MRLRYAIVLASWIACLLPGTAGAATRIGLRGQPVPFSISPSQPTASFDFHARAGERVVVDFEPNAGFVLVGNPTFTVQDATGHVIASFFGTGLFGPYTLPANGRYAFVINGDGSTATGTVALYGFFERTYPISVNGRAVHGRSAPLQTTSFTFSGTAGETIGVDLRTRPPRVGKEPVDLIPSATLTGPDGNTLPISGTYTLGSSGQYTLKLTSNGFVKFALAVASPPDHPLGTIAINGPIGFATITDASTPVSVSFNGTAGEQVTLQFALLAISVTGSFGPPPPTESIRDPSGNVLQSVNLLSSPTPPGPVTLPADGTYTIVIDPAGVGTGTLGLRLTSAS